MANSASLTIDCAGRPTRAINEEIRRAADDGVPAERAHALGLVNQVVPAGEEVAAAERLARRMARMDPKVVRRTKLAINRTYDLMGFSQAIDVANDVNLHIEGEGSALKREFLTIATEQGLATAIEWRNARYGKPGSE